MKKGKSVLFVIGVVVVISLTVLFGYLGFKRDKIGTTMKFSYTDKITVKDGEPDIIYSGTQFVNDECDKCQMNIKWGNPDEEYTFISMVKVIAPSGKVVSFVTGDKADSDLAFALEEKGLYKIESEYLFDGNEYSEAVHRVWPEGETVEVAEDGSVDGFQFDKKDGNWSQCYEIVIVTSN